MAASSLILARDQWAIPLPDGCLIGRRATVLRKVRAGPELAQFVGHTQALLGEGGLPPDLFKEKLLDHYPEAFIEEATHHLLNLGVVELRPVDDAVAPDVWSRAKDDETTVIARYVGGHHGRDVADTLSRLGSSRIALIGTGRLASRVAAALADLQPAGITWLVPTTAAGSADQTSADSATPLPPHVSRRSLSLEQDFNHEVLEGHDLLLALADDPVERLRLFPKVNAANLAGPRLAWLCGFVDGFQAVIGPLFMPGETGCYRCLELREENHLPHPAEFAVFKAALAGNNLVCASDTPSPVLNMASGVIASEAFKVLARVGHPATYQTLVIVDLNFLETEHHSLLRVPFCDVCGPYLTRPFRKTWDI